MEMQKPKIETETLLTENIEMQESKPATDFTDHTSSVTRPTHPRPCVWSKVGVLFGLLLFLLGSGLISYFIYKNDSLSQENKKLMELAVNASQPIRPIPTVEVNVSDFNNTLESEDHDDDDDGTRVLPNITTDPPKAQKKTHMNPVTFIHQLFRGNTTYECLHYCEDPPIWLTKLTINTTDLSRSWAGRAALKKYARQSAAYNALQEVNKSKASLVPNHLIPKVYDIDCRLSKKDGKYSNC